MTATVPPNVHAHRAAGVPVPAFTIPGLTTPHGRAALPACALPRTLAARHHALPPACPFTAAHLRSVLRALYCCCRRTPTRVCTLPFHAPHAGCALYTCCRTVAAAPAYGLCCLATTRALRVRGLQRAAYGQRPAFCRYACNRVTARVQPPTVYTFPTTAAPFHAATWLPRRYCRTLRQRSCLHLPLPTVHTVQFCTYTVTCLPSFAFALCRTYHMVRTHLPPTRRRGAYRCMAYMVGISCLPAGDLRGCLLLVRVRHTPYLAYNALQLPRFAQHAFCPTTYAARWLLHLVHRLSLPFCSATSPTPVTPCNSPRSAFLYAGNGGMTRTIWVRAACLLPCLFLLPATCATACRAVYHTLSDTT